MRISDWSSDVCSSNLEANQIVASSVSGVLAHWRRGNVDFRMGLVLLIGGTIGSLFGVWLYGFLRSLGQLDLVISLCYVIFLGFVGILMFIERSEAHTSELPSLLRISYAVFCLQNKMSAQHLRN